MARKIRKDSLTYLRTMTVADLCRQYWQNHFDMASHSDGQKSFSKRLEREAYDELVDRLGLRAVEGVLNDHLEGRPSDAKTAKKVSDDPKPQRLRAPRVMYIEQKTDGNRRLNDQGPAEIGEVSFSKTGRTLYYRGRTFHREKCIGGNYRCVEDGNVYWISGVKKRGSNRHWAGSGPVRDTTKSS